MSEWNFVATGDLRNNAIRDVANVPLARCEWTLPSFHMSPPQHSNQVCFSVRPHLFLRVFYFISFFRLFFFHFSTFLCCYSCTNIFISYTSTNIVPSVSRGQVISVRFCTLEDQFRSQGSQYGPSGRQRGTVLRCQFSLNVCPVPVHRSFRCVRTTDTLVAKCVIRTRPNPEFLLSCH